MGNTIAYTIKFDSNGNAVFEQLTGGSTKLQKNLKQTQNIADKFGASFLKIGAIKDAIVGIGQAFDDVNKPGLELQSSMADLSAITGVTGKKLDEIEGYARKAALTFGGSAAKSVESYKLILSKLSPEIAKVPAALDSMGKSISTLSKTMGGDTVAATQVLTTAMNQFQVSTDDPIAASVKMAEMMNVMAAAAKEGSAELPQIAAALEQTGMAAHMAGISFAETNAAIQVLDKAGKKGAEGGVALRNVLATLSEGRFLPPQVQKALAKAGVDINIIGNKSLSFSQRLKELTPILNDTALVTKMFGKENENSALAMMSGIGLMDKYTGAIQNTNTAYDQANIVMETTAEKMSRMQAKVDDLKIGMFALTGASYPYLNIGIKTLQTISFMVPALMLLKDAILILTNAEKLKALWDGISAAATWVWTSAQWALNAAFYASPIGLIALGVAGLVAVIVLAWNKFEGFRAVILTVWDTIKGFGNILKEFVLDRIKGIVSGIGALASAIFKLFKGDFKGAWESAKQGAADMSGYTAVKNAVEAGSKLTAGIKGNFNQHLAQEKAKGAAHAGAEQPVFNQYISAPELKPQPVVSFGLPLQQAYQPGIATPTIPGAVPTGIAPPTIPGATVNTKKPSDSGKKTTEAIATGGTKNTNISIVFKDLIGTFAVNHNGNLKETVKKIEDEVLDGLTRVLSLAQANAS